MLRLQHRLDAAVAAFEHAVRRANRPPDRFLIRLTLRMRRRGQAVFDLQIAAQLIKRVPAGGAAFAQTEQAVGEFAAARRAPLFLNQWRTILRSSDQWRTMARL